MGQILSRTVGKRGEANLARSLRRFTRESFCDILNFSSKARIFLSELLEKGERGRWGL
jgi:hypothetical protein